MTLRELTPILLIVMALAGAGAGIWWALRPPRPRNACPKCKSGQVKRTGWDTPKRSRLPKLTLLQTTGLGKRRAGIIIKTQTVYYRCGQCGHKWQKQEGVPGIGSF